MSNSEAAQARIICKVEEIVVQPQPLRSEAADRLGGHQHHLDHLGRYLHHHLGHHHHPNHLGHHRVTLIVIIFITVFVIMMISSSTPALSSSSFHLNHLCHNHYPVCHPTEMCVPFLKKGGQKILMLRKHLVKTVLILTTKTNNNYDRDWWGCINWMVTITRVLDFWMGKL